MMPETKLPQKLNLKSYDISTETGFIPSKFPVKRLISMYYEPWERIIAILPSLILNKSVRNHIDKLPELSIEHLNSEPELRRGYVILSFLTHAYVWTFNAAPAQTIPRQLAVPYLEISNKLGLPAVATYAGLVLWNFCAIDESRGFEEENLAVVNTFTGSIDEQWFYLVSCLFEIEGAKSIKIGMAALDAAYDGNVGEVVENLKTLAMNLDKLGSLLMRMEEMCDPYVFYFRIRPFLAGWKSMSEFGLPEDGILYDTDSPERHNYSGGSNAQSSLIQFFDILLKVEHYPTGFRPALSKSTTEWKSTKSSLFNEQTNFMTEMTNYMPKLHRQFLQDLQQACIIKRFVEIHGNQNSELILAYDACLAMLKAFRDKHIQIVTRYIVLPSRTVNHTKTLRIGLSKPESGGVRGTGGTALLPFLKQCRDETGDPAAGTWGKRILTAGVLNLKYKSSGEEKEAVGKKVGKKSETDKI